MWSEAEVSKGPVWALTPEGEGGRAEVRGQPHWGHPGDSPKAVLGISASTEWSGEFGLLRVQRRGEGDWLAVTCGGHAHPRGMLGAEKGSGAAEDGRLSQQDSLHIWLCGARDREEWRTLLSLQV